MPSGPQYNEKLIRLAARFWHTGTYTQASLAEYFDVSRATIIAWSKHQFWEEEIERSQKIKIRKANDLSDFAIENSKLEYWQTEAEKRAKNYLVLSQTLQAKIAKKLKEETKNNFNEENKMLQGLKTLDDLIHTNVNFALSIEELQTATYQLLSNQNEPKE